MKPKKTKSFNPIETNPSLHEFLDSIHAKAKQQLISNNGQSIITLLTTQCHQTGKTKSFITLENPDGYAIFTEVPFSEDQEQYLHDAHCSICIDADEVETEIPLPYEPMRKL